MPIFANIHYCIYATVVARVGGSKEYMDSPQINRLVSNWNSWHKQVARVAVAGVALAGVAAAGLGCSVHPNNRFYSA